MVVYKLTVAYNGANYHGFQRQVDNATVSAQRKSSSPGHNRSKRQRRCCLTIQQVLENVLLDLYPTLDVRDLRVRCAGRTDKGVHARGQAVAVQLPDTQEDDNNTTGCDDDDTDPRWVLHRALQSRLPRDISVHSVTPVVATFCPRHDVVQKEYSYTIKYCCLPPPGTTKLPTVVIGTPLLRDALDPVDQCWYCPWPLPHEPSTFVCQELCGTHDYRNFCHTSVQTAAAGGSAEDDHRLTIDSFTYEITHQRSEPLVRGNTNNDFVIVTGIFRVRGRKFHRAMVRKLVGYCVDHARGVETVPSVAAALDGTQLVPIAAAPASGLCLEYVQYGSVMETAS